MVNDIVVGTIAPRPHDTRFTSIDNFELLPQRDDISAIVLFSGPQGRITLLSVFVKLSP